MVAALSQILHSVVNIKGSTSPLKKGWLKNTFDLALITDTKFKVLSANEGVERALNLSSSEITNCALLDLFFLKESDGRLITAHDLVDKAKGVQEGVWEVLVSTKNSSFPRKARLSIHSTSKSKAGFEQFMIVISGLSLPGKGIKKFHPYLEQAILRSQATTQEFKNNLEAANLMDLRAQFEMIDRIQGELLTAAEMEDHQIEQSVSLVDAAEIIKKAISSEEHFAAALMVPIRLIFDNQFNTDASGLIPPGMKISPQSITSPYFTVPLDPKWFDYLVQKLLELAILLSSGEKDPLVQVSLAYDKEDVLLNLSTFCSQEIHTKEDLLFVPYYGELRSLTNLYIGSGLEGWLVKMIIQMLGVEFKADYEESSGRFYFRLRLPKKGNGR